MKKRTLVLTAAGLAFVTCSVRIIHAQSSGVVSAKQQRQIGGQAPVPTGGNSPARWSKTRACGTATEFFTRTSIPRPMRHAAVDHWQRIGAVPLGDSTILFKPKQRKGG